MVLDISYEAALKTTKALTVVPEYENAAIRLFAGVGLGHHVVNKVYQFLLGVYP